jgi:hypothetical protein
MTALALRIQGLDEREQALVELGGADRVVHAVAALEQARQDVVEIVDGERVVGAGFRLACDREGDPVLGGEGPD